MLKGAQRHSGVPTVDPVSLAVHSWTQMVSPGYPVHPREPEIKAHCSKNKNGKQGQSVVLDKPKGAAKRSLGKWGRKKRLAWATEYFEKKKQNKWVSKC